MRAKWALSMPPFLKSIRCSSQHAGSKDHQRGLQLPVPRLPAPTAPSPAAGAAGGACRGAGAGAAAALSAVENPLMPAPVENGRVSGPVAGTCDQIIMFCAETQGRSGFLAVCHRSNMPAPSLAGSPDLFVHLPPHLNAHIQFA